MDLLGYEENTKHAISNPAKLGQLKSAVFLVQRHQIHSEMFIFGFDLGAGTWAWGSTYSNPYKPLDNPCMKPCKPYTAQSPRKKAQTPKPPISTARTQALAPRSHSQNRNAKPPYPMQKHDCWAADLQKRHQKGGIFGIVPGVWNSIPANSDLDDSQVI